MKQGQEFKLPVLLTGRYFVYDITVIYASKQVIRFNLKCKGQEMELEKRLMVKSRQPWKVLRTSFQFTKEDAGSNIEFLFEFLNDKLKEEDENSDDTQ